MSDREQAKSRKLRLPTAPVSLVRSETSARKTTTERANETASHATAVPEIATREKADRDHAKKTVIPPCETTSHISNYPLYKMHGNPKEGLASEAAFKAAQCEPT